MLINTYLKQVLNEKYYIIYNKIKYNLEIEKFNLNNIFLVNCISKIYYLKEKNEVEFKNLKNHFTEIILNENQITKIFKLKKTNFKAKNLFHKLNETKIRLFENGKSIKLKPIQILEIEKSKFLIAGIDKNKYVKIKILIPTIFFDCEIRYKVKKIKKDIEFYESLELKYKKEIEKENKNIYTSESKSQKRKSREKILKLKENIKDTQKSIDWRKDFKDSIEFYQIFLWSHDFYSILFDYYLKEKKTIILAKKEVNLTYKIYYNYFINVLRTENFNLEISKYNIFYYIQDKFFVYNKIKNREIIKGKGKLNEYEISKLFIPVINEKIDIVNKILFTKFNDIIKLKRVYQDYFNIHFEAKKNDSK